MDHTRKGLLFAGSENAVSFSMDDGENWQSLRLNMPATSIRDLVIKDDDLVVATHGRSFWILDNITPLRQLTTELIKSNTILYKPQDSYRVRWCMYPDTPLPQEEPAGQNPPDGALIDYYLSSKASLVKLEIINDKGNVIRTYTSQDTMYKIPDVNIPHYWIRPQQILPNDAGVHRFSWDMRYAPLDVPASYPISAIYKNTAPNTTSPFVMPGKYTVRLTVDGKQQSQTCTIKMDPRVKTNMKDLALQHDISLMCYSNAKKCMDGLKEIGAKKDSASATFAKEFSTYQSTFMHLQSYLQESDMSPTKQMIADAKKAEKDFEARWLAWKNR